MFSNRLDEFRSVKYSWMKATWNKSLVKYDTIPGRFDVLESLYVSAYLEGFAEYGLVDDKDGDYNAIINLLNYAHVLISANWILIWLFTRINLSNT
jgi:hypothetical protein